jgi:hypothetical protein
MKLLVSWGVYYKRHLKHHPDSEASVGVGVILMSTLLALEAAGDATKHMGSDGSVTWHTTPKLLANFSRAPGPLVAFGPELH